MDSTSFVIGALSGGMASIIGTRYLRRLPINFFSKIPQSYEEVNRFWLSATLSRAGYRQQNPFKLQITPWITTDTSVLIKASILDHNLPSSIPQKLLIKVACNTPEPTEIVLERRRKEILFSELLRSYQDKLPVVRSFDSDFRADGRYFYIVMEDLTETHFMSLRPLPPKQAQTKLNLAALAKFHAYWWKKNELSETVNLESEEDRLTRYQQYLLNFRVSANEHISQQVSNVFNWLSINMDKVVRLANSRRFTLVHGDAHPWNFLNPLNNSGITKMIDWETVAIDSCANDLIRQIVCVWQSPERQKQEEQLLPFYHSELVNQGVLDYSFDELVSDYRIGIAEHLILPAFMHARGKSPQTWWRYSEMLTQAFVDWKCSELFP